jgi:hypothetical protein
MSLGAIVASVVTAVLSLLIHTLLAPLDGVLSAFAAAGALHNLTTAPWAANLIAGSQAVAGAVLAVRTAWEALMLATARTEGAPTDPGALLKRVVVAAAAIAAGPWLATQAMVAGNLLADAVAHAGLGTGLGTLPGNLWTLAATLQADRLWVPLLLLGGVVIVILCFIQSIVRTLEMTLAAILAPLMALGFLSGGGTADVWFREVVVLAASQAVQLLLLYVAAALLVAPAGPGGLLLGPFYFLGACWVAWRSPQLLRQFAYHTGAGSAAGSVAGSATTAAVTRLLTKLPL